MGSIPVAMWQRVLKFLRRFEVKHASTVPVEVLDEQATDSNLNYKNNVFWGGGSYRTTFSMRHPVIDDGLQYVQYYRPENFLMVILPLLFL